VLENVTAEMASSHQMKRFFRKFLAVPNWLYRQILLAMFLWRLKIEKPKIIVLVGDSMVLDNDDAEKREGVGPTYKNKKGYHPLHITWAPMWSTRFSATARRIRTPAMISSKPLGDW